MRTDDDFLNDMQLIDDLRAENEAYRTLTDQQALRIDVEVALRKAAYRRITRLERRLQLERSST